MLIAIMLLVILTGVLDVLAMSKVGKAINAAISLLKLDLDEKEKDSRMEPLFAVMKRWATPAMVFGVLGLFLAGVSVALAIHR